MLKNLIFVDEVLDSVEREFDFWTYIEPINADSEKIAFLNSLHDGYANLKLTP